MSSSGERNVTHSYDGRFVERVEELSGLANESPIVLGPNDEIILLFCDFCEE